MATNTKPRSDAREGESAPHTQCGHHEQHHLLDKPRGLGTKRHDEYTCDENGKQPEEDLHQPHDNGHAKTVRPPRVEVEGLAQAVEAGASLRRQPAS